MAIQPCRIQRGQIQLGLAMTMSAFAAKQSLKSRTSLEISQGRFTLSNQETCRSPGMLVTGQ